MRAMRIRPFDPGDTDWLVERHQTLYAEAEGFDATFGPLVRSILEDFAARHDPAREAGWIAEEGGRLGSIFCVRGPEDLAKLRLFLLVPEARGRGLGGQLLDTCLSFAKARGYAGLTLWTHESHRAACALYARRGFTCTRSAPVHSFGVDLVEQTWTLRWDGDLQSRGAGSN
ncbi:MAG: GNAT family N-acetyltransferase [Pseudomonadota bacterium]